jgi:hypothetical protein
MILDAELVAWDAETGRLRAFQVSSLSRNHLSRHLFG